MVFDGHDQNPSVEGPKFYKRNYYYYIFGIFAVSARTEREMGYADFDWFRIQK